MRSELYQKELGHLRQLAVEFADKHPAIAPQLTGPSPDPDVERILEGVAFLTANIQQKLQDDFPDFAQSLLQMIFPHYLKPLPASTIIQFTAKNILKNQLTIAKGTAIDSKEVEGTSCRFQTCQDISIAPVSIQSVECEAYGLGKHSISMTIKANGIELNQWASKGMIFS